MAIGIEIGDGVGGFAWDTLATLFRGVAAVVAAGIIGWRQSIIMAEQTAIARGQVDLEQMKLRADLFDRRMAVFQATYRWLGDFWGNGRQPTGEVEREFVWATDTAKLLFRPAIAEQMRVWYLMGVDHHCYE